MTARIFGTLALAILALAPRPGATADLGIQGAQFTIDGKPSFLLGISYYGALGAAPETIRKDLDEMRRLGFNWIRVWATWAAFGHDVSAVDGEGRARPERLDRLKQLAAECDRRGMVLDVTLSRGNGVTGPSRLQSLEAHRRAVETIAAALKDRRNWYLDLANERNIQDQRHVPFEELKALRDAASKASRRLLVTASHAGDLTREDVKQYVEVVGVDFLSPHGARAPKAPAQYEARTRECLKWAAELGKPMPVHWQEPFRRGFTRDWEPSAEDFVVSLAGVRRAGAAGWCFHNGDERGANDGRPRRSFDLREGRLFEQLDGVERKAVGRFGQAVKP